MAKENTLVNETLLQLKSLEDVVTENAKGILASTMKEEIKELVKESLNEADEDDEEIDADFEMEEPSDEDEMDDEDEMGDEDEMEDDEEMMDMDNEDDMEDMDDEEDMDFSASTEPMDTVDLRNASPQDTLAVFQRLGPEDQLVVTKDASGNLSIKDNETNKEYMVVMESEEDEFGFEEEFDEEYDTDLDEMDVEMDEGFEEEEEFSYDMPELSPMKRGSKFDEEMDEDLDETIYEISFGDESEMDEELDEMDDEDMLERYMDEDEYIDEEEDDYMMEAKKMKKGFKAKGVGMGSPNVKVYHEKPNMGKGFKTDMKQGPKAVGTGKAKFEYKEGMNLKGDFNVKPKKVEGKKAETKEASRTLGSGSKFRKGGLPKQRAHSAFNANIKENINSVEVQILKDKNTELRNALNIFRDKLNEVAVFNSNLAYATRLFTEHSTSKQEKIDILKRFDGVETLKESKNLYKSIKDELNSNKKQMNESIERKIEKVQSTGSAVNLIESKTYENPQFLRMKDLMQKIK